MTTLRDMYPAKYLKAEDLGGKDVTLTIHHAEKEDCYVPGSGKTRAWIVYFVEMVERHEKDPDKVNKRLFCNPTNAETIFAVTQTEHNEDWPGHKITLYPTTTKLRRETVPCIRVRK